MRRCEEESSSFLRLRRAVDEARLGTDLEKLADEIGHAKEGGEVTQDEFDDLMLRAGERSREIPYSLEGMPLSAFAKSGITRKVYSKALGETVLFAADNAPVPADNGFVVYRASELKALVGVSVERLRAVHLIKTEVEGDVVQGEMENDNVELREGDGWSWSPPEGEQDL